MTTYLLKCSREMKTKFVVLLTLSYIVFLYILVNAMAGTKSDIGQHPDPQKEHTAAEVVNHEASSLEEVIVNDEAKEKVPETELEPASDPEPEEATNEDCSSVSVARNTDPNHTAAHLEFWRNLDENTIQLYKNAWKSFIQKENGKPKDGQFQGRGIIFVAGNRDTLQRTVTSIRLLRRYGCSLPIEVWYFTPEERPSPQGEMELQSLGATARDLADEKLPRPMKHRRDADKQFQIKAAAIINSAFREILYLDSDNVPTRDPSYLFHSKGYTETGAIFWPDFWKTHSENKIFEILDIPCRDAWEQESGQMVIDKVRSWLPLQLAYYMQDHHEVYFQFLNGDKDTFQYAWRALGYPFHMVETFLGMGGSTVWGRFCGHTMLQYDDESAQDNLPPLFVHANLMKITDKTYFMQDHLGQTVERPWQEIKRYTNSRGNTWLMPAFYIAPGGRACMDFSNFQGEPSLVVQNFDEVLGDFQDLYFEYGGIGGETRSS